MPSSLLIAEDAPFLELLERHANAELIALDCEFHGEKRYRPTLYLVQLGFGDEVVAVDPQNVDLRPMRALLDDPNVRKVFHAGREDVRLLARATGALEFASVLDTQIAAAFLGHGTSIGYARLVKEVLGIELDKSSQFTDWSRELTTEQIDYALNDVRFLPKITAELVRGLEERGRVDWALEASRAMVRAALVEPDPRKLYRKINGFASLGPRELGVLRELAMWRDRIAESENSRPESVASDVGLRQLALRPPAKYAHVRAARGVGTGGSERRWPELHAAVERGLAEPEPVPVFTEPDPRVDSVAALLGVVRRAISDATDVAPELLATTAELRALAEWRISESGTPPALDVLGGWRKPIIGGALLRALAGKLSVSVALESPSGLVLVDS